MAIGEAPVRPGLLQMQFGGQGLQITTVPPFILVNPNQSLPLESSRSENVFHDRFNPQLIWYLPGYQLAADIDTGFSFSALEQSIDISGNPSYQATITLTLDKIEPPDVTAFRTANPSVTLQEIPLTGLTVTLATTASDPQSGQVQQSVYTAAVTPDANGNLALSFNTLLGAQVLVAYYNLQNGGALLTMSAQFEVWRVVRIFHPIIFKPPITGHPIGGGGTPIIQAPHPMPAVERMPIQGPTITSPRPPIVVWPRPPIPIPPTPPPPQPVYVTASDPFTVPFDLGQKYTAPGYARNFTITDSNGVRPILSINDLKGFDQKESEFSEFTALGDVSSQYPSFSRLYIGALSRIIVAIPAAYGIVRSSNGTAAQCQALLDSTAGGSGAAKFQFAFVLGPIYSPLDFFALQTALASNPQSQGFDLVLPKRLDPSQQTTLSTPFQSSVTYTDGPQPRTFELAVDITDGNLTGSAVANANLLLKQLSATVEPFLSGSFGIVLDDGYPHPVMANVVVNFSQTSGSDEITYGFAADGSTIQLINVSPLDVEVSRYAIVNGTSAPPESLNQKILSGQTLALSDKASSSQVSMLVDCTLALENPFTKDALQRYVAFITQDVQNVNYQISVLAAGVDFVGMGIAEIDVMIAIPSLPQLSIPNSMLIPLNKMSNAVISLPIENAISSLPGVISFAVKSTVTTQANVNFTVTNDFADQPVYVLETSSIPPFVAGAPQQ